jgi:hypothetical protein
LQNFSDHLFRLGTSDICVTAIAGSAKLRAKWAGQVGRLQRTASSSAPAALSGEVGHDLPDEYTSSHWPNGSITSQNKAGIVGRLCVLSEKPELKVCKAVGDIFHRAGIEVNSLGHRLQTTAQLRVAFFHMVSDFTTLECCGERVRDAPPRYRLPLLQRIYLTTQRIRLRHGRPALEKVSPNLMLIRQKP